MWRWFAGFLVLLVGQPALCGPAGQPVRIMPLGDSITQAAAGHASYRYWLWQRLQAAGYAADFVGSMHENHGGPAAHADFDGDHEGHWGWRIDQVLPELDAWLAAARPQIVLCHLGTNDFREPIPQIVGELSDLIDKIRAYDGDCAILLAQLIPLGDHPKIVQINRAIAALVADKAGDRGPLILVDQYSTYDGNILNYDRVHPNEQGEQLMAERWFAALKPLLEAKPEK